MTDLAPPALRPRVQAFGDSAVIIELALAPGLETSRLVNDLAGHLAAVGASNPAWPGTESPVPAATTILVPLDPVDPGTARSISLVDAAVASWRAVDGRAPAARRAVIEIPVQYGGDDGPDLQTAARLAGISPESVIELHSGVDFEVAFLGFAPGFAYLGPLPEPLIVPRRPDPRTRVPAGSVAIGGPQTAVYPAAGPGGWWLIGRTSTRVWDPLREPAALLRPGARVRFRPVAAR